MNICALSGFLGLPSDWSHLKWKNLNVIDWQQFSLNSMTDWGKAFNQNSDHQKTAPNILMGYSLGGRLALHALIDQPNLWQGAIIISTHSGLIDDQERLLRQQRDREWATRFENENWDSLMDAWNMQEVFANDPFSFSRKEIDYQRPKLAQALIGGSLGGQADLCQQIASLPFPILWITGALDSRYCQIGQGLTFSNPNSSWKSIKGAGHRVPWSHPQLFSETARAFLKGIALG